MNIIGNVVKFIRFGFVFVFVSLEKYDVSIRWDLRNLSWCLILCDGFVYICIVVKDIGLGVRENDIFWLFNKFV